MNKEPLFGCCQCYEDYSYPARDLVVVDGELWCDNCFMESDMAWEKNLTTADFPTYVPEYEKTISALRAENEKLKEQIKGDTMAHDGLVKMVDEYEAKLRVAVGMLEKIADPNQPADRFDCTRWAVEALSCIRWSQTYAATLDSLYCLLLPAKSRSHRHRNSQHDEIES